MEQDKIGLQIQGQGPTAPEIQLLQFHGEAAVLAEEIAQNCMECGLCQKDCLFLKRLQAPKGLAQDFLNAKLDETISFECSLCGLCQAVCPKGLQIHGWMLQLRRIAHQKGVCFSEHEVIRAYEKRGTSSLFTYYALPTGCDTIFFPGCALPGTRPEQVKYVFNRLKELIPGIGIVLDCCTKPSHDLGDHARFLKYFQELLSFLQSKDIQRVIVACPNCFKVFKAYGRGMQVSTVYEVFHQHSTPRPSPAFQEVMTIHDPCVMRSETGIQQTVRQLAEGLGVVCQEMKHAGKKTVCCGEGGSVGFLTHELAENWGNIRKKEAQERPVITYCAGCSASLKAKGITNHHILDLLYEKATGKRPGVFKAPLTYFNRLMLKRYFKKALNATTTRERPSLEPTSYRTVINRIGLLLVLVLAILAVHISGIMENFTAEHLQELVRNTGSYAPICFILLYSITPVLFLPGLPMTLAAGVLFGPVFGVIYSIIGATLGATLAFLVARYVAGQWILKKLRGPRWKRLFEQVREHGWKAVAFTRLIPLFPFNLLNYAFGLTPIPLIQYVVVSFFCMLPACIAYVVFSSSLLDVLRGHFSWSFIIGLLLILLISILPIWLKRHLKAKDQADIAEKN